MPYKLIKTRAGYFVADDTGKRYSENALTRTRAVNQLRALYASEKKKEISLDQASNLLRNEIYRKINPAGVSAYPDAVPSERNYYIVNIYSGYAIVSRDSRYYRVDLTTDSDGGVEVGQPYEVEETWIPVAPRPTAKEFSVFKDQAGRYRWVLFSSNAYRDRDGEIVSTKALEDDVNSSDGGNYGPLRFWHQKGWDIGDCDWRAVHGRMLIESGTFRNERIGAALKEKAGAFQVSIGFNHPPTEPDQEGVFNKIKIFERSLVPRGRAANPFTRVIVQGETMATKEERMQALKDLLGGDDEMVQSIISGSERVEKELDEAGIQFKSDDDVTEKAKAKPAPEPEDETEEVEELTEEELADLKIDLEDEDEEEDAKEFDPDPEPVIASMTVKEFAGMMTEIVNLVLTEAGTASASLKEYEGERTRLKEQIQAKDAEIKKLKATIKEMEEGAPKLVKKQFIASESEDTVQKDNSRLKGAAPSDSSVGEFINFIVNGQQ